MDGDSLPVSAFEAHVDGTFELGAAAYEKRGVAVNVPAWDATKCIQCNQCSFVCPHATIRPYALTEEGGQERPAAAKIVDIKAGKGKGVYKFAIAVSPLDCMGCGVCAKVCPCAGPDHGAPGQEAAQQDVFNYMVANVHRQGWTWPTSNREGAASSRSLCWSSPAPAPAAPRPLMPASSTQVVRRPDVHLQRHRLFLHLGRSPAATSPYATTAGARVPPGPTPCSRDNAEHGLGMYLGQKAIRERLIAQGPGGMAESDQASESFKRAFQAFLDTKDDSTANGCSRCQGSVEPSWRRPLLRAAPWLPPSWLRRSTCPRSPCGSSAATAGPMTSASAAWTMSWPPARMSTSSCSTPRCTPTLADRPPRPPTSARWLQFAAAGKTIAKKSLAEIAMTYGYVYVAQVAMGANMNSDPEGHR